MHLYEMYVKYINTHFKLYFDWISILPLWMCENINIYYANNNKNVSTAYKIMAENKLLHRKWRILINRRYFRLNAKTIVLGKNHAYITPSK